MPQDPVAGLLLAVIWLPIGLLSCGLGSDEEVLPAAGVVEVHDALVQDDAQDILGHVGDAGRVGIEIN